MGSLEKKTVLVSGNFNVLHPGHLRLLKFAKDLGGRLIVAVKCDKLSGRDGYIPEALRLEGVRVNSLVDEAFIHYETIEELILRIRPDIVVKGKEHEALFNSEKDVVESYGGKLVFSSGEAIFSSLDLMRAEFRSYDFQSIFIPEEYMERHKINKLRINELIESFSKLRVCVIGDLIIDEYITCQPLGMSQEDPTIVVTPIDSTRFIGGAGIVAAHASGLGADVRLISVVGDDCVSQYAFDALNQASVKINLFVDESRPTTLKQRYRSKGKTLFRVSHLHQGSISIAIQNYIFKAVEEVIKKTDLLVFSDFNYGCLPQDLVERICNLANEHSVMMVADSQSSSQVGDIGRFKGMELITPTEHEARISVRDGESGLVVLAEKLRSEGLAKNIFLKLGEEGLLVHACSVGLHDMLTDRIEALNTAPKDVAGAGDSLLISSAMALASGGGIWEAAIIGSLAAAVQVGRVGNTPLSTDELMRELG